MQYFFGISDLEFGPLEYARNLVSVSCGLFFFVRLMVDYVLIKLHVAFV